MYYNQKSAADPCGYDESVNTYQFPLTSTPPGTCGTPPAATANPPPVSGYPAAKINY
jgi:hypothetical protein